MPRSEQIAGRLSRKSNDQIQPNVTKSDLIELLLIGIGILAVINAIPELLNKLTHYLYFNEFGRVEKDLFWDSQNRKAEIIYSIFKLAVGILLVTNARQIAGRLPRTDAKAED